MNYIRCQHTERVTNKFQLKFDGVTLKYLEFIRFINTRKLIFSLRVLMATHFSTATTVVTGDMILLRASEITWSPIEQARRNLKTKLKLFEKLLENSTVSPVLHTKPRSEYSVTSL